MSNALKNFATEEKDRKVATPQTERATSEQVVNNAGGFTFKVSDKDRLERFLILGTDGGTYYVKEKALTKQNVAFVKKLIKDNERLVVDTVVDVSTKGRAAKNSPALFVLALVFTEGVDKAYARAALPKVARTATHLFEFAEYIKSFGGWGRAKRSAIAEWYTEKDADKLAYQVVKYRQRNGWEHRDLFRLSHPQGVNSSVADFVLGNPHNEMDELRVIEGFKKVQKAGSEKEVVAVLTAYPELPWEAIPTQFLKSEKVWKTLFYNGAIGQTALLRNVTRMSKIGAFNDMVFKGDYAETLADQIKITRGRVHPIAYANALFAYRNGVYREDGPYGYLRHVKDWTTDAKISGALEAGFYNSFAAVEPSRKRTYIGLDVSGSMSSPAPGLNGMTCRDASAVMAMVTLRSEPYVEIHGFSYTLQRLDLSATDSLETVVRKISRLRFGSTDCSLPMVDAKNRGIDVDTFVVYTDNETWAGRQHPFQALKEYRKKSGRDARLAVVGIAATDFTIADPSDKGMMDFVGFDSNAPKVLADFSAGRI